MGKIVTLEERLRARALEELKDEVDRLLSPIRVLCNGLSYQLPRLVYIDESGKPSAQRPYVSDVLRMVRDALVDGLACTRGQQAVDAFIQRVDGLQSELDDLRGQIDR